MMSNWTMVLMGGSLQVKSSSNSPTPVKMMFGAYLRRYRHLIAFVNESYVLALGIGIRKSFAVGSGSTPVTDLPPFLWFWVVPTPSL